MVLVEGHLNLVVRHREINVAKVSYEAEAHCEFLEVQATGATLVGTGVRTGTFFSSSLRAAALSATPRM